ncbi:dienelactone hydrolase family protein [Neobacillus sp. DY30]|uniref:dienelactone hydrolase family protein n=1 Tax=Neobacillus sp. DY30 TaxID=3047871 RepID=UPI0024C0648A|nr:dienelactone hydrolase family protein [Neobacillus sp. DY30]WHY03515.1 dienelactone hydrolase family protein [Neobacillus sp. DY30]
MINLLGERPQSENPSPQLISIEKRQGFVLESLMLHLNDIETVPAYFAKPLNAVEPLPTVIFNHSHGGNFDQGKEELLSSSSYLQNPSFLEEIIELGFAVCSIDMWGFNQRKGKQESELVKEMLLDGQTLWGMRLFDNMALLDYLETRSDVDHTRIATIGMSMGGLMSWWLAALDERIKVTVDIAAQVDIEILKQKRGLDHHGFYYYVPGFLKHFTTLAVQEMIAPRPRLSMIGKDDRMCPIEGAEFLNEQLKIIYEQQCVSENWEGRILTGGHQETKEMRALWKTFIKKHL